MNVARLNLPNYRWTEDKILSSMKPWKAGDKLIPMATIILNNITLGAHSNYMANQWQQLYSLIFEKWVLISNRFGSLVSLLLTDANDIKLSLYEIPSAPSQSFIFRSLTHEIGLSALNKHLLLNNLTGFLPNGIHTRFKSVREMFC